MVEQRPGQLVPWNPSQLRPLEAIRDVETIPAGGVIYQEGFLARELVGLRAGTAMLVLYRGDKRQILEIAHPFAILGWESVSNRPTRYASSAVALTDCEIQRVKRDEVAALIASNPEVGLASIIEQLKHEKKQDQRAGDLTSKRTRERLAQALFDFRDGSQRLPAEVTQQLLADYAAMTRESANKHLKGFERQRLISSSRPSNMEILQPDLLRAIANERFPLLPPDERGQEIMGELEG